jgi:hypothetical protein
MTNIKENVISPAPKTLSYNEKWLFLTIYMPDRPFM